MRDTELYRHLLGVVAPWTVRTVELSVQDGRVDVWVEHPRRTRFACPECERKLSVYDHSEERAWRHLDSCAFLTYLHCHPPRVDCPEHGVRQVRLPWAEPHSRFTVLFERLAIDVLGACDVAAAAGLLRISWDEAWHLMDRAVARGLAAKPLSVPAHVGVDEKAAGRGQDYITVVSDLDAGTVEYIADERRQAQDRFAALRASDLKTARAWAIKESLRHFWSYQRRGWGAKHFKRWYFWATHSRLKPIIDAAKTLKRHEAGLLSYFAHRITNAGAEGLNSRIQAIRVSARGYRNREHFKTAIYFHLGGLQLYPVTP